MQATAAEPEVGGTHNEAVAAKKLAAPPVVSKGPAGRDHPWTQLEELRLGEALHLYPE